MVEVISGSKTQHILHDKVADYTEIGVEECWLLQPETRTVELLQPSRSGKILLATLVSPDLLIAVAEVFQP